MKDSVEHDLVHGEELLLLVLDLGDLVLVPHLDALLHSEAESSLSRLLTLISLLLRRIHVVGHPEVLCSTRNIVGVGTN